MVIPLFSDGFLCFDGVLRVIPLSRGRFHYAKGCLEAGSTVILSDYIVVVSGAGGGVMPGAGPEGSHGQHIDTVHGWGTGVGMNISVAVGDFIAVLTM